MRVVRVWSFLVSSARPDQEIDVTSSVSLLMAAMMITSDRSAIDSADNSESTTGYLDAASAARLVVPGKCSTLKCHGRVLCLRRKSLVLLISSSVLSPKIFVNGLWSETTDHQEVLATLGEVTGLL